jgi:hypothetical protein
VARKLAVILHKMWINETDFCWTTSQADKISPAAPVSAILQVS